MYITSISNNVVGEASQAMDSGVWCNAFGVRRCPAVVC